MPNRHGNFIDLVLQIIFNFFFCPLLPLILYVYYKIISFFCVDKLIFDEKMANSNISPFNFYKNLINLQILGKNKLNRKHFYNYLVGFHTIVCVNKI